MEADPTGPTDPGDEPLDVWAARREERRAAHREITGNRRAVALGGGAQAAHVAPREPRLLLEWDGTAWTTVGVAEDAEQARAFLGHVPPPADVIEAGDRQPRLGKGTGRHRRG
jgi:hypothetical protein